MGRIKFKQTEIGEIPCDWNLAELRELCEVKSGKRLPKDCSLVDYKTPYPYIRVRDLDQMSIKTNNLLYLDDETHRRIVKYIITKDDVYISIVATVGLVGLVPEAIDGANLTENCARLTNLKNIKKEFLAFYLNTKNGQDQIKSLTVGTTQAKLALYRIKKIKIPLPSLSEQEKIGRIIQSLNLKIAINNQMNKTFESIGHALFKRWFVDFEFPNEKGKPYKSSGGKMVESELGEIPEGWEVNNATKLFKLEYGWHLPEWDRKEGNVPVYGSGGLTGYHNSHFVEGPGIIIGRAGKVGIESVYYSHLNFCPIETTFYVSTENKKIIHYLYFFLRTLETVNTGSSVPNLSRRDIHGAKIMLPDIKVIETFDKIAKTLFDQINNNEKEIKNLSQIRDSLLPRLMSGKIRVE